MDLINTERTIKTLNGHYINVFDPNPDHICIEDIAHALSQAARWGGHSATFYSVAQHSIWVSKMVPQQFKLEALLHDATEAYIGDMPKPIKRHLPDFNALETGLDIAIRKKFKLPKEISVVVKQWDYKALQYEWDYVKHSYVICDSMGTIKKEFIRLFNEYSDYVYR